MACQMQSPSHTNWIMRTLLVEQGRFTDQALKVNHDEILQPSFSDYYCHSIWMFSFGAAAHKRRPVQLRKGNQLIGKGANAHQLGTPAIWGRSDVR